MDTLEYYTNQYMFNDVITCDCNPIMQYYRMIMQPNDFEIFDNNVLLQFVDKPEEL